jgi:hypothetical protein
MLSLVFRHLFGDTEVDQEKYKSRYVMKSVVFWVITRRRVVIIYPEDHRFHQHRGVSLKSRYIITEVLNSVYNPNVSQEYYRYFELLGIEIRVHIGTFNQMPLSVRSAGVRTT